MRVFEFVEKLLDTNVQNRAYAHARVVLIAFAEYCKSGGETSNLRKILSAIIALFDLAESVNVELPAQRDVLCFATELTNEYYSYSKVYEKTFVRSIENGVRFVLNEHMPQTKRLFKLAEKSYKASQLAKKKGTLAEEVFAGVRPVKKLGNGEFRVRKYFRLPQDAEKEAVTAVMRVRLYADGSYMSMPVPAVLSDNQYFILESDFRKILEVGNPVARVDFSPCGTQAPHETKIGQMPASQLAEKFGYKGKDGTRARRRALKSALGELQKSDVLQYLHFRVNMASSTDSRMHDQLSNLLDDLAFVQNYTTDISQKKKVRSSDLDLKDRQIS